MSETYLEMSTMPRSCSTIFVKRKYVDNNEVWHVDVIWEWWTNNNEYALQIYEAILDFLGSINSQRLHIIPFQGSASSRKKEEP